MFSSSSTFRCTWRSARRFVLGKELFFFLADVGEREWTHVCRGFVVEDIVADFSSTAAVALPLQTPYANAYRRILHRKMTCLQLLLASHLSQHEMTASFDICSTTGRVIWVRPHSAHALHFSCSKLRKRCESDPCVRIQYGISDSELRPEVLTSTLRVWRPLHTKGMQPYHVQRIQHLEPAHMCSRLELCRWINLLKPTGYVMHQQFNIQQLYVLPTLYLCVLYLSENKQRLVPLTS